MMITFPNLLFLTSLLSYRYCHLRALSENSFLAPVFACGIRDPGDLESVIQVKESGIPLTIGIQNLSFISKESEIPFLESEV